MKLNKCCFHGKLKKKKKTVCTWSQTPMLHRSRSVLYKKKFIILTDLHKKITILTDYSFNVFHGTPVFGRKRKKQGPGRMKDFKYYKISNNCPFFLFSSQQLEKIMTVSFWGSSFEIIHILSTHKNCTIHCIS